jgi:hypothetical protein
MEVTVSFVCGTSIEDACTEAKNYAITNNLAYTKFDFNGISCAISQRADVGKACEKFLDALKEGSQFKFFVE